MIREDRYFVEEMDDETIVFDRSNGRCHCLNQTAARVWRLAEGEGLTKTEVIARLEEETGSDVDDSLVELALARLRSAGIVSHGEPAESTNVSRRDLLKRAAMIGGLVAVPTVVSIVAPLPASAQTVQCVDAGAMGGGGEDCPMYECPAGMDCVPIEDADVGCECVEP
jgi:PqqD family protein of HPr-rel-A system